MGPRAKPAPHRLGPPPQLTSLKVPVLHQQFVNKVEPKLREVFLKQTKNIARWFHNHFTWRRLLLTWMVLLIASKMVLLLLTYEFFTLTSIVSLEIFHGLWTIAFICLAIIKTKTVLPNASCLLAGYLPATTVLHILLIPSDYPLAFIISDAMTTLLAIVTMFILLRMECSQLLKEADGFWVKAPPSDAGTSSTAVSSEANSPQVERHILSPLQETVSSPQYQVAFASIDPSERRRELNNNALGFEEGIDLEPIDFEHFIDEPELERPNMERMFRVSYGESAARGR